LGLASTGLNRAQPSTHGECRYLRCPQILLKNFFSFHSCPTTTYTTLSLFRDTKSNSFPKTHLQQPHLRTLRSHNFLPTTVTTTAASTHGLSRHRKGSSLRSQSRNYSPAKSRIHQFHLNKLSFQPYHQSTQPPPQTGQSTILFLICSVGIPSISKHSWQQVPQTPKSILSKRPLTKQCRERTSLRSGLVGRRQTKNRQLNRPVSKPNPLPSACPQFNFWIQLMARVLNLPEQLLPLSHLDSTSTQPILVNPNPHSTEPSGLPFPPQSFKSHRASQSRKGREITPTGAKVSSAARNVGMNIARFHSCPRPANDLVHLQ